MTYQDALTYLEGFVNYERSPKPSAMRAMNLERMHRLIRRLGHLVNYAALGIVRRWSGRVALKLAHQINGRAILRAHLGRDGKSREGRLIFSLGPDSRMKDSTSSEHTFNL